LRAKYVEVGGRAGTFTRATGGTVWTKVFTLPLPDVRDVKPYLDSLTGEGANAETAVKLELAFDLGTMANEGSGWRDLLIALGAAGKFVNLDLSLCDMTGTVFNPASGVSTGKDKIVSIALPNTATS
jgi:hypothetical protein